MIMALGGETMNFGRKLTREAEKYKQRQMREEARKKREGEGVLVHGAMKYRCRDCGYEWYMFLEKGLEDPAYRDTDQHKPVPFATTCGKCQGIAYDISGYLPIPEPDQYVPLPDGESYFANYGHRDCGSAILAPKDR